MAKSVEIRLPAPADEQRVWIDVAGDDAERSKTTPALMPRILS
jgi:hypothetical protein